MGREEITALIAILQHEVQLGTGGHVLGTRHIHFDAQRTAFVFDKCEAEGYCQERPAVIALDGHTIDPGGPLFDDE